MKVSEVIHKTSEGDSVHKTEQTGSQGLSFSRPMEQGRTGRSQWSLGEEEKNHG